jgi:hypothetical protein
MGYISWNAENGKASNFSQEISISSANTNTAWKAQVRISPEDFFGIAVIQRDQGIFEAEFGTYSNQVVVPLPSPGAKCDYLQANAYQPNLSNCKISIQLTLPAKVRISIERDPTDSSGKTWLGYYANVETDEELLISRFNVGQANLKILDIVEYTYQLAVNECQTTPAIQQAIWWRPTSTDSKFNFSSTWESNCGTTTFYQPQSYVNADGVLIRLNTPISEKKVYKNSIFEVLDLEIDCLSDYQVICYPEDEESLLSTPDEESLLADPEIDCDPEFVLNCFADDEDSLLVPASPEALTVTFNSKFINVEVQVPGDATRVILYSPEFGVSKAKPLVGAISSGFASFKVALNSLYAGKKGVIQLIASNASGESAPLKIPVTAPKLTAKAAPKKVATVKPKVVPRPVKVTCIKGAIKRSFDGTKCPSGYTKG